MREAARQERGQVIVAIGLDIVGELAQHPAEGFGRCIPLRGGFGANVEGRG